MAGSHFTAGSAASCKLVASRKNTVNFMLHEIGKAINESFMCSIKGALQKHSNPLDFDMSEPQTSMCLIALLCDKWINRKWYIQVNTKNKIIFPNVHSYLCELCQYFVETTPLWYLKRQGHVSASFAHLENKFLAYFSLENNSNSAGECL